MQTEPFARFVRGRPAPYLATLLSLTLAACGGGGGSSDTAELPDPITVSDAATRCPALTDRQIPASAFALPTGGATVSEATLLPADANTGVPAYCRVRGAIAAADSADPPILFQVNLPSTWNVKALQFGGGGFNGTVVTGTGNVNAAPASAPTPLMRGYVTFGGDSGHSTPGGSFGLNAQALANYGGESVKRTHDVAVAILESYYDGAGPARTYHIGGSKGGHEGLVAAQRYPEDYDGIVAYYPANQNQAMVLSWYRMWQAAHEVPGAWLTIGKQAFLKAKVMEACDALDGAVDGIVSNLNGCQASFDLGQLRCTDGLDTGDSCLSDPQLAALRLAANPIEFSFPLAYGVTSIGPYPVLTGGDITGHLYDGTPAGTGTSYFGFNDPVIRFFIQQDPSASSANFDYRLWQPRVEEISRIYDATNPDLDTFKSKGGKLIIVQGTTDMLVTHTTTTAYVNRLSERYSDELSEFVRYYIQPGYGHATGTFNSQWDSLTALEDWSERAAAPVDPVATDANAATRGRTRPLCEYPSWPKYTGSGDVDNAANFSCVTD